MDIPDPKTEEGQHFLNQFLVDKSFLTGFSPCQADVEVFQCLAGQRPTEKHENLLRWYNNIDSFGAERKQLPQNVGVKLNIARSEQKQEVKLDKSLQDGRFV